MIWITILCVWVASVVGSLLVQAAAGYDVSLADVIGALCFGPIALVAVLNVYAGKVVLWRSKK